jgi:stringent starvation protein B
VPDEIPTRPYLIRAIYDWAVDNGYTPHLLVDADAEGVTIPPGYAQDGRVALNIHPQAVQGLTLANDAVRFSARFGGRPFAVVAPVAAVLAIYARESERGFYFQPEPDPDGGPTQGPDAPSPEKKGPSLKIVK